MILTVKGQAAAVVQDAEGYQRLLDIAVEADTVKGIRQGRDLEEFLAEFETTHGISR